MGDEEAARGRYPSVMGNYVEREAIATQTASLIRLAAVSQLVRGC